MHVLFLALGANRKKAVVEEAAQVMKDGGSAVVLVDRALPWQRAVFGDRIRLVEVSALLQHHLPARIETVLLYKGPRFLLNRVLGRGRLRRPARRAAKAYEKRIADPIHRKLFLPAYQRLWPHSRSRVIARHVLRDASFDWVVVTDALSMPDAARLLGEFGSSPDRPKVVYSIDHVPA